MQNCYFFYSATNLNINVERFHICNWEFKNSTGFVEFGCEINPESLAGIDDIQMELFIPWLNKDCILKDFYEKLKESRNSRFIFNDSVLNSASLDGGRNTAGIVHEFAEREPLCVLPVTFHKDGIKRVLSINVNLNPFNEYQDRKGQRPNIYFRFSVTPFKDLIPTKKMGITKSTILYDIRLNERRNVPENLNAEIQNMNLCNVRKCFCFNIIPNSYDLVFLDSTTLKSIRNLEFGAFKEYLGDERVKQDELIVVFNKKSGLDSYTFFSIFSKEHIGSDQIAIALVINLFAGIILFLASISFTLNEENKEFSWSAVPTIFWITVGLLVFMVAYVMGKSNWRERKKLKS